MPHAHPQRRRSRQKRFLAGVAALTIAVTGLVADAGGSRKRLAGYRVEAVRSVARDITSYRLSGGSPSQRIWVTVASGKATERLRIGVSRNRIAGKEPRRETTARMCRRQDCLVAVNGDFYGRLGWPRGAIIRNRQPVVSQSYNRPHLVVSKDGSLRFGKPDLGSRLIVRYPPPPAATQQDLLKDVGSLLGDADAEPANGNDERVKRAVSGVNVRRGKNDIVLYTRWIGKRTGTNSSGLDVVFEIVKPSGPVKIGRKTVLRAVKRVNDGNAKIPKDGVVLSARGKGAEKLRTIWKDTRSGKARRRIWLRFRTDPAITQATAGRPILIRNGDLVQPPDGYFARARLPRTVVGWTAAGDVLFVTIDGRRPGAAGMSLQQAARLMKHLGARNAINLDGGGSTTFVIRGKVRNRPSSGLRSVVSSLLLVPS